MSEATDPKAKQEFMTMIGHSLEILEVNDWMLSKTNRQSIRNGILETISELMDKRDAANARAETAEARVHGAEFWTNYSYPGGATPEEIQNELLDYHQYLEETAKVYDHITGGLVSKQNTMAFEVISIYDEKVIGLEDRAEKAEARAERLQVALDLANRDAARLAEHAIREYVFPENVGFRYQCAMCFATSNDKDFEHDDCCPIEEHRIRIEELGTLKGGEE